MNRKIIAFIALSAIFTSGVNAGVFVPETNYNLFTKENYMYKCGITEESQTTKYCKNSVDSEEFQKKLKVVNWYGDFEMLMRQKMYSEMVWDTTYNQVEYWNTGKKVYTGKEAAYREISEYASSFESWVTGYLRDNNDTEEEFKANIRSNLFSMLGSLENLLVGFRYVEIQRENLINAGLIEENDGYQTLYLSNIDEIERLFREKSYKNMVQGDKENYDNIYFPNVRKYLELEKQWTTFYRDFTNFDKKDFEELGYTQEETEKGLNGEYQNTYDNKAELEYEIDQTIGENILSSNSSVKKEIIETVEKTKLENYAEKWGKDINKDYPAVEKVIVNYIKKYKAKNGVTQSKVNSRVNALKEKVPLLVETYEKKYNTTYSSKNKEKYKKYVWLLLLVEKALNENEF